MPLILPHTFFNASRETMKAARFDGSDGMTITPGGIGGGIGDGSDFALSFWIKFNGGDGQQQQIFYTQNSTGTPGIDVWRHSTNTWRIRYYTNAGAQIGDLTSSNQWTVSDGWQHFLLIRSASNNDVKLYINGSVEVDSTASSTSIEWTVAHVLFGRSFSDTIRLNGDIADFFLFRSPNLNPASSSSVELFIKNGKPVKPPSNGQMIPGNTPYIYLSANEGSFQTNLGLGNSFTINTGDVLEYVDSGLEYVT